MAGLGAMLSQGSGRDELVVAHLSKTLSEAEALWVTNDLECYAIVCAVDKWRPYPGSTGYPMDMTVGYPLDIHEMSPADLIVPTRKYPMDIHMDILWIRFQFINIYTEKK